MVIQDIDIWGAEEGSGQAIEYFASEAVKNALQLWLGMKKGEYLMNPSGGGALDNMVFKTMSPQVMLQLKFQLMNALNKDFSPALQVNSIDFIPDVNNRLLEIDLNYTIISTGIKDNITLFTNSNYSTNNFEYESVDYVSDNLLEFFTIKKPDMISSKLIFDHDANFYKFGKYKFPNLTPADPKFDEILMIANGS